MHLLKLLISPILSGIEPIILFPLIYSLSDICRKQKYEKTLGIKRSKGKKVHE